MSLTQTEAMGLRQDHDDREKERSTLLVVVGFSGCLSMFRRFLFLTFRQYLWLASSEELELCLYSGVVCGIVECL